MKLQTIEAQEFRFQQILALDKKGFKQSEVASLLGCTQGWVSKVLRRARVSGTAQLQAKKAGHPKTAALTAEDLEELARIVQTQSPTEFGFETDGWTRPKVGQVIFERFGVKHDLSHISRLMKKQGFSLQKPKTFDYRQSAEAVKNWREKVLPRLKKSDR